MDKKYEPLTETAYLLLLACLSLTMAMELCNL